ncbi:hypothetical protein SAMN05192544_1024102 [Paraburkholderia hospita]|nr:hypothetical protein SAMN05192544_1024102 [Paraburkholderia hospita]
MIRRLCSTGLVMGRLRRRGIEFFLGFLPAALGVCCWGFRGAGGWSFVALARVFRCALLWRERCALWVCLCDGIREMMFAAQAVWSFCFCAGIRALPSCFMRRPCAGRHLLFFAAAKKSRQKKAANTANSSSCLRAPNRSLTSHGNLLVPRSLPTLQASTSPASHTRVAACHTRYSTAAQVANCV